MKDTTIIYYTSNREDEIFERKIIDKLLNNSNSLPIISVSQKPIDLGENICVGEQPYCDATAYRQLLIGLKKAQTTFAIAAESDCLYPPEYFTFIPPTNDNVYRFTNVWILYNWVGSQTKGLFWKKRYSEGAQMCGREYWIKMLEKSLEGIEPWDNVKYPPTVFNTHEKYWWSSENPVINIKTGEGLRKYTSNSGISTDNVPYWGKAEKLRENLNSHK